MMNALGQDDPAPHPGRAIQYVEDVRMKFFAAPAS
jgi:hypothetical protein